jgi:TetR/AcrR family transcriptional regulator, transcriptional repressor for nem operon
VVSRVREKIVSAAIDRFHALGFSACGVQEIVDKAGVPKGSFYNYFKAKELLALEVIEIWAKGSNREMLADARLPAVERLRKHFEFLASRYKGFGNDKGCLLGKLAAGKACRSRHCRLRVLYLCLRGRVGFRSTLVRIDRFH